MSLLVWLPLITNTVNKGLLSPTITTTGTISYSAGKIGNALTFNNSALTLNPAPITGSTSEFSFAFWYKPTDTTNAHCIYNGRATVGGAVGIFRLSANTFRFDDGAQHTFTYKTVKDTWQHIVFTRDNTSIKLYVNGVLNQTMTSSSFTSTGSTASIGLSSTSGATPSDNALFGQLNDYRIYDHVLSKKEVKELAKGLCMNLPLDWGGNPNMIKDSYTWMNKNVGSHWVSTGSITKAVIEDDTAPCRWVYKVTKNNSAGTSTATGGAFYGIGTQGLALTDLVEGETYTYSFWAKADSSNDTSFNLQAGSVCESQTMLSSTGFTNLDSNWRKHTVTFKWTKTTKLTACFYCNTPSGKTQIFYCCGLKLEKGSVATPYIPHVDETAYTNNGYATKYLQDCSGYNRTVTVNSNNIISVATDAPRGTGTNITKSGKLTIANSFPVGTFPSFTVNAWIRTKSDTTYTLWYDFFGISATTNTDSNSLFRMEISNTAGTAFNWYGPMADSGGLFNKTISTDTWYMVTLVSDGTKFIGYLNGVQYATKTPDTDARKGWKATGNFYIGDSNIWFDVTDVRAYATALSAEEVKELYQVSAQIDKSGNFYCGQLMEV